MGFWRVSQMFCATVSADWMPLLKLPSLNMRPTSSMSALTRSIRVALVAAVVR